MESLSKNWITEKYIDFEYKKYVLLAWLQHVNDKFSDIKLYPSLSELIEHYRNVIALKESKHNLFDQFPAKLSGTDLKNFKLMYDKLIEDDTLMQEIENIISFSIPQFEKYLTDGKQLYDFIESKINIYPVGVVPLNVNEGYILLLVPGTRETQVYEYQVTLIENPNEKLRSIYTKYLCNFTLSITNTVESIKQELIRYNRSFPNPATYAVESSIYLPVDETMLPLAKRSLMKFYVSGK
ncbi:MAG: hypothetical protein LC117_08445 [Bacteroidia bacterium]|nr:hypothetical protein [Bacteroidia bacterium]MCZ2277940.1 hypothetical protein [Bacteroidia bacterium]